MYIYLLYHQMKTPAIEYWPTDTSLIWKTLASPTRLPTSVQKVFRIFIISLVLSESKGQSVLCVIHIISLAVKKTPLVTVMCRTFEICQTLNRPSIETALTADQLLYILQFWAKVKYNENMEYSRLVQEMRITNKEHHCAFVAHDP